MLVRAPFGGPPTLQQGSSGAAVTQLQTDLAVLSYLPSDGIDGVFGPNTLEALQQYQNASGLTPTGIADGPTWDALSAQLPTAWTDVPASAVPSSVVNGLAAVPLIGGSLVKNGQPNWPMIAGGAAVAVGLGIVLYGVVRRRMTA